MRSRAITSSRRKRRPRPARLLPLGVLPASDCEECYATENERDLVRELRRLYRRYDPKKKADLCAPDDCPVADAEPMRDSPSETESASSSDFFRDSDDDCGSLPTSEAEDVAATERRHFGGHRCTQPLEEDSDDHDDEPACGEMWFDAELERAVRRAIALASNGPRTQADTLAAYDSNCARAIAPVPGPTALFAPRATHTACTRQPGAGPLEAQVSAARTADDIFSPTDFVLPPCASAVQATDDDEASRNTSDSGDEWQSDDSDCEGARLAASVYSLSDFERRVLSELAAATTDDERAFLVGLLTPALLNVLNVQVVD